MADQSQTAANQQSEASLCKQGCGFFVSTDRVLVSKKTVNGRKILFRRTKIAGGFQSRSSRSIPVFSVYRKGFYSRIDSLVELDRQEGDLDGFHGRYRDRPSTSKTNVGDIILQKVRCSCSLYARFSRAKATTLTSKRG